jgi:hypothetical protein
MSMKKPLLLVAVALGAIVLLAGTAPTGASEPGAKATTVVQGSLKQNKARYHRKRGARVYGYYFGRRIGGYSYAPSDVVNTYGLSRSLYGSTNSYRDPFVDRQTAAGPFDSGFFFDSGIAPRGGDSPYLH